MLGKWLFSIRNFVELKLLLTPPNSTFMKKSNIFAYIELSKFVEELRKSEEQGLLKERLKSLSAYFKIIESRYFSDTLIPEWEGILSYTRQKKAGVDEGGNVISNSISNSIESLSLTERQQLVKQINELFEKVKIEFQ